MRPEGSVGLRSRSWSVAGEREGWSAASERTLRHGDDVAWCDREVGRQVTIVDDLVQADGVAGGSAVAPAIQAGAVRRRALRAEERRVGKECVSTWRSRWSRCN